MRISTSRPAIIGTVLILALGAATCSNGTGAADAGSAPTDAAAAAGNGGGGTTIPTDARRADATSGPDARAGRGGTSGTGTGGVGTGVAGTGGAGTGGVDSGGVSTIGTGAGGAQGGATGSPGTGKAAAVAAKLGRPARFLVGMGNDLANNHDQDGAYTLGVTLDIHYAYLVGLQGEGGWPDWNSGGTFVDMLTDSAKRHGVIPMFTLYSMAARGEAQVSVLTDDTYMKPYWDGAKLLFQRLGVFGYPAIVHFEPDWWAYAQQASAEPAAQTVHVTTLAPDCASLPDNMIGMGKCLVLLARKYAPDAIIGFHASAWAAPDVAAQVAYLVKIGAAEADIVVVETLDRDAGCFEAKVDPNCQRSGTFYWDESNATSPNFREHLSWAKAISDGVGKPLLWWQMPFGVPSTTPGGTAGHYRDNRVKYLFEHPTEFVAAGGLGAVFGVGAGNQTYITTDGDQFKNAVTGYLAAPTPLP
jgi:hypothetical protein